MKFTLIAVLAAAVLQIQASTAGHGSPLLARHREIGRAAVKSSLTTTRSNAKRCKRKPKSSSSASQSSTKKATSTKAAVKATATPKKAATPGRVSPKGTLQVSGCGGGNGATSQITKTSGPNGSQDWLSCGLTGGGWHPPNVQIGDLVMKDIDDVFNQPNTIFAPCKQFAYLFKRYGNQYGIPPMFVAAFAMQESTCQPYISPGGLMQITSDKCGGAPGGQCNQPDFNVRTGTKYFADVLKSVGGNVLLAIGQYNGWSEGMTAGSVLSKKYCQQNLDYLQQFVNGWIQGVSGYDLGKFHNGGNCPS